MDGEVHCKQSTVGVPVSNVPLKALCGCVGWVHYITEDNESDPFLSGRQRGEGGAAQYKVETVCESLLRYERRPWEHTALLSPRNIIVSNALQNLYSPHYN